MTALQQLPQLNIIIRKCKNSGFLLHDQGDPNEVLAGVSTPVEAARIFLDEFQRVFGVSPYEHVMPQQVLPPVHQPQPQQYQPQPVHRARPQPSPPEARPEPMPRVVEEERRATARLAEQIAEVQRGNGKGNGTFG